jgi:hypothetical protein
MSSSGASDFVSSVTERESSSEAPAFERLLQYNNGCNAGSGSGVVDPWEEMVPVDDVAGMISSQVSTGISSEDGANTESDSTKSRDELLTELRLLRLKVGTSHNPHFDWPFMQLQTILAQMRNYLEMRAENLPPILGTWFIPAQKLYNLYWPNSLTWAQAWCAICSYPKFVWLLMFMPLHCVMLCIDYARTQLDDSSSEQQKEIAEDRTCV